jgi:kinesin family protein 5
MKLLDDKTLEIDGTKADGSQGQIKYNFDGIFDHKSSQADIFERSAKGIVEGVMQGFNGTVLAYGQTSSGKTHTMTGPDIMDTESRGVIPRMVSFVFD